MVRLGVVAIGRNEGKRLGQCLASANEAEATVYVDSGSTDGSVEVARGLGVEVVELDPNIPFSAARARNEGFARLLEQHPDVEFVQFIDSDCEFAEGWLAAGQEALEGSARAGVVCGRLRERNPEMFSKQKPMEIT